MDLYNMNAKEIYDCFKSANITCFDEIVYDEETDINNQLGRPGCYTSKVNFNDAHWAEEQKPYTIEAFDNTHDAFKRKVYVEEVFSQNKILPKQYIYLKGNALVRMPFKLVPKYAKRYEQVLDALLAGENVTGMFEAEDIDYSKVKYGEKNIQITFSAVNAIIPDLSECYALDDFKYYAPKGWLFKQTQTGNYHYAKEVGSLEGGYIYCTINKIDNRKERSMLSKNPDAVFETVLKGISKSGIFKGFGDKKEKIELASLKALRYYTHMDISNKVRLCGNLLVLGSSSIYSFSFILPNYSEKDYQNLIDKFVSLFLYARHI